MGRASTFDVQAMPKLPSAKVSSLRRRLAESPIIIVSRGRGVAEMMWLLQVNVVEVEKHLRGGRDRLRGISVISLAWACRGRAI